MKQSIYAFGLALSAAIAAPLAAQSTNGPWWDPGRTQTASGRNGSYDPRGQDVRADGVWRADGRDRSGNTVYVRTRYASNGDLVREYATKNFLGRYSIFRTQQLNNSANGRYGTYDASSRRQQEERRRQAEEAARRNRNDNDRWSANGGHDNGRHNGRNKTSDRHDGRNDRDRSHQGDEHKDKGHR